MADRLERANLANIVKKLQAGKTLTQAEQSILLKAKSAPSWADNYVALAGALNVSRRTLNNWKKLPGAPKPAANGKHDVNAWLSFKANLKGEDSTGDEDADIGDLPSEPILRRRKLKLWCDEREIELARLRGEVITVAEVRADWERRIARIKGFLKKRLENELPPILEGMDAPAIHGELVQLMDELCEVAQRDMDDAPAEEAAPSDE